MSSGVYDNGATWAAAVSRVFNGPEAEREEALLRLYSKDVVVTVDKNRMNWDEFVQYVKNITDIVTHVDINIHHWFTDGKLFASLHTTVGHRADGSKSNVYCMAMGGIGEDGKANWIEERAQFLEGVNPQIGKGDWKE